MQTVKKFELAILGLFLGMVPILFCFIAAWFTSVLLASERFVPFIAFSGLASGIIIDFLFLKRWVKKAYELNNKILAAIFIFYSIIGLGFCMGLPILNLLLGVPAGFYTASRMYHKQADQHESSQNIKRTAVFTSAVMVIVCVLITLWAIAGKMIGSRFDMPPISFTFTVPVFFGIVLGGGCILVLLEYWLTKKSAYLFRYFVAK